MESKPRHSYNDRLWYFCCHSEFNQYQRHPQNQRYVDRRSYIVDQNPNYC